MIRFFKRKIIKVLGLLLKEKDIPVLEAGSSVLDQCYLSGKQPLVLRCPVDKTCWSLWEGSSLEGLHPIEWAAKQIVAGVSIDEVTAAVTDYFSEQWKLELETILGLTARDVPGLAGKKGLYAVNPWDMLSPGQRYNNIINNKTAKNLPRIEALSAGQITRDKCLQAAKLELGYVTKLIESIGERGYLRNNTPDGDIRGELLVKKDGRKGQYRIIIRSGQHRYAVLLARGDQEIPVRIFNKLPGVIRMEEVNCWPNVVNGTYTAGAAGLVFEKFFTC